MIKDPNLLKEYQCLISEQLNLGIIEPVDDENSNTSYVHYLPHHPVIKQDRSTTKVQIYDGSASASDDISLNDCLQVGPNLIPKQFNMLIQFRHHRVALVADIEKAFLMVSVAEEDRDMLRFLWMKDPLKVDSEIIQFRFTRIAFGLRPSPAILGAVISLHLAKYHRPLSCTRLQNT